MSVTAYLSLGSNLGDREGNIRRALAELGKLGALAAVSAMYETEPREMTDQPWFLNCAAALTTDLSAGELMHRLLAIERAMGRERPPAGSAQAKGPRLIDLDIILFGEQVIDLPGLTVPHPAAHERRFVLAPLAEIAPAVIHPTFKKPIKMLLQALPPDAGAVRKLMNPED